MNIVKKLIIIYDFLKYINNKEKEYIIFVIIVMNKFNL